MGLHPREATDESSLLEVDGLANFAAERFRLTEPSVYRPPLQATHSTVSEWAVPASGPSLSRIPYEPAAGPFYAATSRTRSQDDPREFPPPVERGQAGDLGLSGYRRQASHEYDTDSTGNRRPEETSRFFRDVVERPGDYFSQGFAVSDPFNIPTDPSNNPPRWETARYLGQSSGFDANLAAESPLPSRYTGTPQSLQGRTSSREDKISASKLTRLGGRRRRVLARWLQAIGAVVVAGGALGATFYADPPETPPPAGSAALIALCILPFLSLCCSLYFFYLRHGRSRKQQRRKMPVENPELRSGNYAYPTVNFIVDPGYFARMTGLNGNGGAAQRADGREDEGSPLPTFSPRSSRPAPADSESLFSYSVDSQSGGIYKTSHPFAPPQLELDALRSSPDRRHRSKKESVENAVYDLCSGLCWLGLGIWTITEEARCPAGQFAGYCNLYNTALAFACLTGLLFLASFVFDCLDYREASRRRENPYGRS